MLTSKQIISFRTGTGRSDPMTLGSTWRMAYPTLKMYRLHIFRSFTLLLLSATENHETRRGDPRLLLYLCGPWPL